MPDHSLEIGIRAVPECEPPFDPAQPPAGRRSEHASLRCAARQLVLDLEFVLPNGLPARPHPTGTADPALSADPAAWAALMAQALAEVLVGARPLHQVRNWTTAAAYEVLRLHQGADPRPDPAHPRVRTVHLSRPANHAVEVSATTAHGGQVRALAFRLEAAPEHWTCTAIEAA